jgi:small subunit ribosomal protein S16
MAVHIRLARHGAKKAAFYRIVVTDQRNPRDGRFIESLGTYDPLKEPVALVLNRARLEHWRQRGARPSATVDRLLKRSGAPAET